MVDENYTGACFTDPWCDVITSIRLTYDYCCGVYFFVNLYVTGFVDVMRKRRYTFE